MNIMFKRVVKPVAVVVVQPDNLNEMNKTLLIHYTASMNEEIVLAQRDGPQ